MRLELNFLIWKVVCVMSNKKEFLNLGKQPITNSFLTRKEFDNEYFYELSVVFDDETKLVSLKNKVEILVECLSVFF